MLECFQPRRIRLWRKKGGCDGEKENKNAGIDKFNMGYVGCGIFLFPEKTFSPIIAKIALDPPVEKFEKARNHILSIEAETKKEEYLQDAVLDRLNKTYEYDVNLKEMIISTMKLVGSIFGALLFLAFGWGYFLINTLTKKKE